MRRTCLVIDNSRKLTAKYYGRLRHKSYEKHMPFGVKALEKKAYNQ